jgi:hypothetical protein
METTKWGKSLWISLHTISFNAPDICNEEETKQYILFFNLIGNLLPCKYCRTSYKKFMKALPIEDYASDKMGLTYWLYIMHNLVNLKLDKTCDLTFKEVVYIYEKMKVKKQNYYIINKFVNESLCKYEKKTQKRVLNLLKYLNSVHWTFN